MKTVELEELPGIVQRSETDIVIGSEFDEEDVRGAPGWVGLSLDPTMPTRVSVCGKYSEIINPTLDKLLAIIEEVE